MPNIVRFVVRSTLVATIAAGLYGCIATAIGVATVAAIDVVYDRRSVGTYIDDNLVELKIRQKLWTEESLDSTNISVTSMNNVVLMTGQTPTEEQRQTAIAIARSFDEVRQVINEIQIAGKSDLGGRTNDTALTAKVKTRLFGATNLDANRVKVVTEDRTVYLMGLVTEIEAQSAVDAVREVEGVKRVVKVFEYIAA